MSLPFLDAVKSAKKHFWYTTPIYNGKKEFANIVIKHANKSKYYYHNIYLRYKYSYTKLIYLVM